MLNCVFLFHFIVNTILFTKLLEKCVHQKTSSFTVKVKMEDSDYKKKLDSLRRYIPFLKNMMTELKAKGNRQAQLAKIQSLHDIITDTRKK